MTCMARTLSAAADTLVSDAIAVPLFLAVTLPGSCCSIAALLDAEINETLRSALTHKDAAERAIPHSPLIAMVSAMAPDYLRSMLT